ncbi:MAG TPA: c-type cytochrome [Pyrinomonadaceae bacterium]|nr:c-type cytochrome [Pyrinomonadaceae bacterium]
MLLLIFLVIGWKVKTAQTQSTRDKPVEQVRKNIQVLKGLPDSQLFLLMNFVGDSLGVNCDHCHVKGEKNPQTGEDTWLWERDDKKEKARGRDMMRMVLELNRTTFNREAVVTCYTCHRGSTRPERMAPLPPRDYFGEALKPQPKRVLPTALEVIAKYRSAVGANRQDVLTQAIVMRGTVERVERAKASGPIEIVFKQPNKARITETLTSGVVTRGWNGTTAWVQTSRAVNQVTGENLKTMKAMPATSIVSDGLFSPIKILDATSRATLIGVVRINDRESYQVTIEDSSTPSIQLFFDVESGLLLRRVNVTNTMLGPLNVQWDFSDYRDVSGIKLPFLIRTSDVSSYDTVVRRFSEIKIDSSVKENVFDTPRAPSGP